MSELKITLKDGVLSYEGPGPEKNGDVSQDTAWAYLNMTNTEDVECIASFCFSVMAAALATCKKNEYDFILKGLQDSAGDIRQAYLDMTKTKFES